MAGTKIVIAGFCPACSVRSDDVDALGGIGLTAPEVATLLMLLKPRNRRVRREDRCGAYAVISKLHMIGSCV